MYQKRHGNPQVIAIAAMDRNRGIGDGGDIPWRIPEDWARFKAITMGHSLIMGRKTFESLKSPLRGRRVHVVSTTLAQADDAKVHKSLEDALEEIKRTERPESIFICGGAGIYADSLKYCDLLLLTLIDHEFKTDTYFPSYDEFGEVVKEESGHDTRWPVRYVTISRTQL